MGFVIGFERLKKRNKILFTFITAFAIVLFWKGSWGLADIILDSVIFGGHIFWSNLTALIIGTVLLGGGGVLLEKIV